MDESFQEIIKFVLDELNGLLGIILFDNRRIKIRWPEFKNGNYIYSNEINEGGEYSIKNYWPIRIVI